MKQGFPITSKILINETERLMEKSTQINTEPIFEDVKAEVSSLHKFGEPLRDEPPRMSHSHGLGVGVRVGMGVPFMTGFTRALPMVQPCSTNARTNKISIETFRCGEGWFDKKRIIVFHFLEMAL